MIGRAAPRRIVTGEGGRGSIVEDDAPVAERRTPVPGLATSLIWATGSAADYNLAVADFPRPRGMASFTDATMTSPTPA